MRAVVLVGGFGTRLRPLTDSIPKPLLPIANVPLIVHLVRRLERGGVDGVVLALGFRPEPFLEAFPDSRCGGVALDYAIEPEPLDTAGAIRFAAEHAGIDDTFVVANGDVLTDLDVGALAAAHRRAGAEATIHVIPVADPSGFGVVERDGDRVVRFVEKPAPGAEPSNLANAGTYVFEPSVLDRIPAGQRVSIERDTFPAIAADGRLFAMATEGYWIDAGKPDAYLQANLDLVGGAGRTIDVDADVDVDAIVVDTPVGARARIGAGATVTRSVVLPGGSIGAGAVVTESLVLGHVGAGAHVVRAVVGADGKISDGARVSPTAESPSLPSDAAPGGVLVVGGAGFIGSHLVERLIAEGRAVDVVDDLSTGSLANLSDARAEAAGSAAGELRISTLDAGGEELPELIALRRPREVYHLALVPRHDASARHLGRSFTSVLNVLEAARRAAVGKVVVALPATALYGHPASRDLPIKERALTPRGVRGVVAKAIVDLLLAYREGFGIEFTALAPATVYGPRQRPDGGVVAAMVAAFAEGVAPRITGDGRQTRDFVYVDDVVDALYRAGQRGSGLVVNVGTGTQTALRELWARIAPDAGEPVLVPARPDDLARFAVSPVRARIHLGWAPWTDLDEGLLALR